MWWVRMGRVSTEAPGEQHEHELHEHAHVHTDEMHEHERVEHDQHNAMKVRLARLELLLGLGHTDAGRVGHHLPAWLRPTQGEHRLPVATAIALIVALQLRMPDNLSFPPKELLPA